MIARVFKELGYIEQWGSGIARIKSACEAQGLAEPRIREKGDFVDVEFYREVPDSGQKMPDSSCEPETPPDSAAPQGRTILAYIDQHGLISASEAASSLAVKERRARAVLQTLVNQGLIEKRGRARQTVYVRRGG